MRANHLILIVPDLEALIREAGDDSDVVSRIMSRGRQSALDSDFPQFSLLFPEHPPPGAAAIARHADLPEAGPGCWLRCDPIAMVPDLTRVWVGETRFDELPAETFDALRQALCELFADEELEFHMPAPGRGYIRLAETPDCHFHPPWRIAGEPLEHVLPEGCEATRWRRLLNESQVLLHGVDELKVLPQPARPTSVWFWGAGPDFGTRDSGLGTRGKRHHAGTRQPLFPRSGGDRRTSVVDDLRSSESRVPSPESRNLHVIGDDPMIRGLSDWLEVPHHPESSRPDGGCWLVQWEADRKRSAAESLGVLEEQWLKPAWSALKRMEMRKLTLASMTDCWVLRPLRAWI